MNKTAIQNHIVDALATYICIRSIKEYQSIWKINIDEISQTLGASLGEREKALRRAQNFIRDFM